MFIILAIIILIVSFAIALVSLVMEEKKRERLERTKDEEVKVPAFDEKPKIQKEDILATIQKVDQTKVEEVKTPTSRAPFLWEEAGSKIDANGSQKRVDQLSEQELIQELGKVAKQNKVIKDEIKIANEASSQTPKRVGVVRMEDLRKNS